jgi:predicted glycoside hydrolase/deacetylase ChbG (UPF0249 family)
MRPWIPRSYTFEAQAKADPLAYILGGDLLNHEISMLTPHCGYVDVEIFHWSTMNFVRLKDFEALLSPELKKWVQNNNVGVDLIQRSEKLIECVL